MTTEEMLRWMAQYETQLIVDRVPSQKQIQIVLHVKDRASVSTRLRCRQKVIEDEVLKTFDKDFPVIQPFPILTNVVECMIESINSDMELENASDNQAAQQPATSEGSHSERS